MSSPSTLFMPIKTRSMANARLHWAAKAQIARDQREAARILVSDTINRGWKPGTISMIRLTRLGTKEMDCDNLASSMKHVRDGICDALKITDGPRGVKWEYEQQRVRKREHVGVCVEFVGEQDKEPRDDQA